MVSRVCELLSEGHKKFQQNCGTINILIKEGAHCLKWNEETNCAFNNLRAAFTTVPILKHSDLEKPFIVEVDASDTAVGVVLSQHFREKPKLHPIAFFSKKLSSKERNYNVGDWELLAMKIALEEWRQWLEGAIHPFLILTDHKNLEYLHTAWRLNPRQAQWALFFARFKFTLSYRPESKSAMADALSRIHSRERRIGNLTPSYLPHVDSMP